MTFVSSDSGRSSSAAATALRDKKPHSSVRNSVIKTFADIYADASFFSFGELNKNAPTCFSRPFAARLFSMSFFAKTCSSSPSRLASLDNLARYSARLCSSMRG